MSRIDSALVYLEANRFVGEEMESFATVMKLQGRMVMQGKPAFSSKDTTLRFLTILMQLTIYSINDEWAYRLASNVRTIAASTLQVPRLPWEVTLYGETAKIEGVAETIEFDASVLGAIKNVRTAAIRMLVGTGARTFSDYKSILSTKEAKSSLRALDRFWDLEAVFLEHYALDLGLAKLNECCLGRIPLQAPAKEDM